MNVWRWGSCLHTACVPVSVRHWSHAAQRAAQQSGRKASAENGCASSIPSSSPAAGAPGVCRAVDASAWAAADGRRRSWTWTLPTRPHAAASVPARNVTNPTLPPQPPGLPSAPSAVAQAEQQLVRARNALRGWPCAQPQRLPQRRPAFAGWGRLQHAGAAAGLATTAAAAGAGPAAHEHDAVDRGNRTLVVHHRSQPDPLLQEGLALVRTATGATPDCVVVGSRNERALREGAALRSGVLAQVAALVAERRYARVVFNLSLSGPHAARIQDALGPAVVVQDRTACVLDIFKLRAASAEARLQVRLADLRYQASRLVRRRGAEGRSTFGVLGREAEVVSARGRGGQGTVGGGGEKELADQAFRIRTERVKIERQLEAVRGQRRLLRAGRARSHQRSVVVVGYTNAGKSSLLSALCGQDMGAEDKLFATLDTRTRRVDLPEGRSALFVDTVGFIEGLPLQLVQAFRATLEEAVHADALVHVIDASSERALQQRHTVHRVLASLGVPPDVLKHRMLEVWNKCDLLLPRPADPRQLSSLLPHAGDAPESVDSESPAAGGQESQRDGPGPAARSALLRQLTRAYGADAAEWVTPVLLVSVKNGWGLDQLRAIVDIMLQKQQVAVSVEADVNVERP